MTYVSDPFAPVDLTIEFVDSVAGSQKTRNAIKTALLAARRRGTRTIFAMPTLALVTEMVKFACDEDGKVPVYEITSNTKIGLVSIESLICKHIASRRAQAGHLLFITHEGFQRVADWPSETAGFEIYIDEVLDVVLSRKPFKLRDSHWVLTSFLDVVPVTASDPSYYQVIPKISATAKDPLYWLKRREYGKRQDDIYEYLEPVPKWLVQGNALFTDIAAWNKATIKSDDPKIRDDFKRGLITITGFLRPDALKAFARVTVMSALFTYTMLYAVWKTLGVTFVPSQTIDLAERRTALGKRKLKIYWLSDEGWSKRARDQAGGITNILNLIKDAGAIDPKKKVCIVVNKDDGSEKQPRTVTEIFSNGIVMPNNVRGQNRWREHSQLIHCAALNSYTSDIRWMESVLGIDSDTQRIGRTGQEVYQALMRLSLRDPTATDDITLVVMDKDVAEWLLWWFTPTDQVEVAQIDASGVIKRKGKAGRPPSDRKLSNAERQRRKRLKRKLIVIESGDT